MKKALKCVLAFTLASSMLLSLAACKTGKDSRKSGGEGGTTFIKKGSVIKEDDPFFTDSKVELKLNLDNTKDLEDSQIFNPCIVGDKIIAKYYCYYKMPEELEEQLYTMGKSEDKYEEIMKIYEQYYKNGLAIFSLDGEMLTQISTNANEQLSSCFEGPNGETKAVLMTSEKMTCTEKYAICTVSETGELTDRMELDPEITSVEGDSIMYMPDGNMIMSGYGSIVLIDKTGKKLNEITMDGDSGRILEQDGKYYVYLQTWNYETYDVKQKLIEIDMNDFSLSKNEKEVGYDFYNISRGTDGYYRTTSDGVEKVDLLSGEKKEILNWNYTDLNRTNMAGSSITIVSENEMYTFEEESEAGKTKSGSVTHTYMVKLKRADKNPHAGKKVLQLGVADYIDSKLVDYIVKYNKDNTHTARILIFNLYGDVYTSDNKNEIEKKISDETNKLYLDMMAGEGPDILLNFSSMSQFNNDSILMDLNTLVDGTNGLKRDEYFDNVLRAFEKNGKLYHIPVNFSISCYVANKDVVGDRTSWTFDEFMNVCKSLPDKMSALDEITKEDLLETLMDANFNQLVDYNTKKVSFDTPEFKKMLEIANQFGVNENTSSGPIMAMSESKYEDYEDKLENDLLAMRPVYIDSFTTYADYASMRKGKVTFIGSPSYQQGGLSALSNLTLAISATCADKECAWEFIRFLFSEDEQYSLTTWNMSIPLNRKALERKTETDIEWYNEMMGNYMSGPVTDGDNSDEIVRYDFSKEAQAAFVKLIERVTQDYGFDTAISQIIKEDVAGYFSGQRTADDVCKSIQNRTQTVINERG